MADQSTDTVAIAYAFETTYGVAPSTGGKLLRFTGESLNPNVETTTSGEIVASRQSRGAVRTAVSGQGGINFEASFGDNLRDLFRAALGGTWSSGGVLQVGTALPSLTVEKAFTDLAVDQYLRFTGQLVDGLSLNVEVGSLISGSVNLRGSFPTLHPSSFDATPDPVSSAEIMDTVDYVQAVEENGTPLGNVIAFSFDIANNVRLRRILGSAAASSAAAGQFNVTGTLRSYFDNVALLTKYLNNTTTSLELSIGGASSQRYDLLFSVVKFTGATVQAGGPNDDVLVDLTWEAAIHPTASTLQITETV